MGVGGRVPQITGAEDRVCHLHPVLTALLDDDGEEEPHGAEGGHDAGQHHPADPRDPQTLAQRSFCLLERVRERSSEGDGCIERPIRDLGQVPHVQYPALLDSTLAAGFPGFLGVELQLNSGHVGHDDGRLHRGQLDREPARPGPDLQHPPAGLKEAAQETPVQLQQHQCFGDCTSRSHSRSPSSSKCLRTPSKGSLDGSVDIPHSARPVSPTASAFVSRSRRVARGRWDHPLTDDHATSDGWLACRVISVVPSPETRVMPRSLASGVPRESEICASHIWCRPRDSRSEFQAL